MNYNEWLNILDSLENTNQSEELLKKLQNTNLDSNINSKIIPHLENTIINRMNLSIKKKINDLDYIFTDQNTLDLTLVTFKKEIKYNLALTELKQLPKENQEKLKETIKKQVNEVYEILKKEAIREDPTGVLLQTIKYNEIKWS